LISGIFDLRSVVTPVNFSCLFYTLGFSFRRVFLFDELLGSYVMLWSSVDLDIKVCVLRMINVYDIQIC